MAVCGAITLIWRMKLAECVQVAIAPVGASFTALALVTGMLWGQSMWGAYRVWYARLTAELVLLFLYLGVSRLPGAFDDPRRSAPHWGQPATPGPGHVPLGHFSVATWSTLHP